MPRGIDTDAKRFREYLEKGVILIGGEAVGNNSIDPEDDDPVHVAIMVNVIGYGPHVGVIAAVQGGHVDEALQTADEILEEWEMDHNPDYFAKLEKEYGERAGEAFRETFDGVMWMLSPEEFVTAISGTEAEKYIDVVEPEEEGALEEGDEDPEEEDDDDFDLETELEDGAVVSDARGGGYSVSFGGKHLGDFDDFDEALLEAYRHAEKSNYFPNFFYVNDRGNTDLLSVEPDVVRSKIVGVTNKIIKSWV